jgi:hypothetical protein
LLSCLIVCAKGFLIAARLLAGRVLMLDMLELWLLYGSRRQEVTSRLTAPQVRFVYASPLLLPVLPLAV